MVEKRFRLRVLGVAVRGGKEPTTGETGVDSEGETMQSWKEGRVEGISIPSVGVLLDRPCCLRRGRAGVEKTGEEATMEKAGTLETAVSSKRVGTPLSLKGCSDQTR